MKIVRVSPAVVEANYNWTYVRIWADDGTYGTGESFFAPGLTGIIRDLSNALIGQDPRDVDRLWRRLRRAASGAGSVSGIVWNAITGMETALLDLVGKSLGVPVWQLLGGRFRSEVRMYADCHAGHGLESIGPAMETREPEWYRQALAQVDPSADPTAPESYARRAREAVALGFDALKFDLDVVEPDTQEELNRPLSNTEIDDMAARVAAVRAAIGPEVDLALDCHWRYSLPDAVRIAHAMEPFGLLWLEDAAPPYNAQTFVTLRQQTRVPLCTGENLYLRQGFRELIEKQAVHIISPDAQKTGGLLEMRRIADFADTYDILVAPHCIASALGTMASVHLCAAIPNFVALEFHGQDVPFYNDIISASGEPLIRNGRIPVPETPGLGVELNEDAARQYALAGEGWFE